MRLPTIRGVIDRRILLNYRVDPQALAESLPSPFRPQLFDGWGLTGVCPDSIARCPPKVATANLRDSLGECRVSRGG